MLSPQEIESIKKQIISQIEVNFPEDKKEAAKKQIEVMGAKELEEFLSQNNLIKTQENNSNPFRLIIEGKIPSHRIDENKHALAVLEINPISEGHSIIIPKNPIKQGKKIPKYLEDFIKKVEKKLKTKLKPKKIERFNTNLFEETIINILPVYSNETKDSPRKKADEEDLKQLSRKIGHKEEVLKTIIHPQKIESEKIWLPKRIP